MASNEFILQMISGEMLPPIQIIEEFTHRYPWCAIGHKSLFKSLCTRTDEAWLSYAPMASAYLFCREELFTLAYTPRLVKETVEQKVAKIKEEEMEMIPDPVERIVVVGGDYFAPSELRSTALEEKNPIDKFIITKPKLVTVLPPPEEKDEKSPLINEGDDNFMTETLAKIYADQSLYQLAIDAYEKLILLYPKKSDYFAVFIHDLKYKLIR
ncbi:MAG: hypothetical protein LBC84_03460 [Prevotellaceae bacterium]|jgi:hypothetical protein|nr:hypothetical protein [Prevotellaceae bacterium]